MPFFDYACEGCDPRKTAEKHCSAEEAKNHPTCEDCGEVMHRVYSAPSVSWVYFNPSGHKRTSSLGPAQRADRRHAGWHNGVKQLKPIHKDRGPTRVARKVKLNDKT